MPEPGGPTTKFFEWINEIQLPLPYRRGDFRALEVLPHPTFNLGIGGWCGYKREFLGPRDGFSKTKGGFLPGTYKGGGVVHINTGGFVALTL